MDLQLKNKVVLVTGGAKGIGAAITRMCAEEGAIAVAVDRDASACQQFHDDLRSQGLEASFINMDLASADNCSVIVEQTLASFGRIDALVNNAGLNDKVGLEHGNPKEFVHSLERNLLHYYNMAHYCVPHLKRSRGSIVNIMKSTVFSYEVTGDQTAYWVEVNPTNYKTASPVEGPAPKAVQPDGQVIKVSFSHTPAPYTPPNQLEWNTFDDGIAKCVTGVRVLDDHLFAGHRPQGFGGRLGHRRSARHVGGFHGRQVGYSVGGWFVTSGGSVPN